MSAESSMQTSNWSSDLEALLKRLQRDTLVLALPGICLAGLLVLATKQIRDPVAGMSLALGLLLLAAAVWVLQRRSVRAAGTVLVLGCLAINLLVVVWGSVEAAICLLVVPVGLATLTMGSVVGFVTALSCTLLLLFARPALMPVGPVVRAVATMAMWSVVGMICLTLRPLLAAVNWAWSGYEHSRILLEQARDYQVQLQQTLADLTDANLQLARLNRQVDGLRLAAEEARQAKEAFVANVSHELRTPLNMIVGFSEAIIESPRSYGGSIPPKLLADLTVVRRNSQHLASLINDVLDLSQMDAGHMTLTRERVTLRDVVAAAAVAIRPLFESKELHLETSVPEDLPSVFCDRTRVREIILNLLSNAGRFTEHGGIRVEIREEGNYVVCSVADTGPGIAEGDREKLFQPFRQLDASLSRRYGGSGLGLSISKNFVELHGGRMWVESAVGVGTTFLFALPINPPVAARGGPTQWIHPEWEYRQRTRPSLAPPPLLRPRVVVLEPEKALQRLLTRCIDDVDVVATSCLDEAIEQLSNSPAQALVVNAPTLDEPLQRLSTCQALPVGVPVIICSVPGVVEAVDTMGVSDYLVKPVLRDTLLAALGRLELAGKTVLVVDDEPDALRLFRRILSSEEHGYRVLVAGDGRRGLQIMREQSPDVVLLDLIMPELDGFQFLAAKSEDRALCDIPVLVISAQDPTGHPIVSNALAITQRGGLSAPQLTASLQALSRIFSASGWPGDPAPKATPSG